VKLPILNILIIVVIGTTAAACRQPDGPMPAAEGDVPNQLGDLSRDLLSFTSGDSQARQDFLEDLKTFGSGRPAAEEAAVRFGTKVASAIEGRTLSEQAAQQLARTCWLVIDATELSERQSADLQETLRTHLVSAGVPEAQAAEVTAEAGVAQKAVSTRPRRWYEMF
jgi:hypothetical protein